MNSNLVTPILITAIAGLSTVIGAVFVKEKRNNRLESLTLAFATGIMLTLSIGELFPEAKESLGLAKSLILFCIGVLISLFLDLVLPDEHDHSKTALNKQPGHFIEQEPRVSERNITKSMIVALLLHNILEGLATGLTAFNNTQIGISMAIGIALHNIPIGMTIAVSEVSSGRTKSRAILASTLIGLSQPLGAAIGLLFYRITATQTFLASSQAIVAGILIFIAFDELWPAARKNGNRNLNIIALLAGICFIVITESL